MLLEKLNTDLKEAMKDRDEVKVSALRFLISAVKNLEIDKYPPSKGGSLSEEDVVGVIKKQVKTHKESIEMFAKGGRVDLVNKEKVELSILESYLPEELDDSAIRTEVAKELELLKQSGVDLSNSGKVIGMLMGKFKGRAEGAMVAQIVKEELTK